MLTVKGVGVLQDFLELVDREIESINSQIKELGHPEINGLADRGEYFIGIGFAAVQQHLVESIMFTGLEKIEALNLGPIHSSGISCANLINSCANWWKHESEWWDNPKSESKGQYSILHVTEVTESPMYQLSNVLASLCPKNEFCFKAIIPKIIEWKLEVYKAKERKL